MPRLAVLELRRLLPSRSAHVLNVDPTKGACQRLYELACQLDLEGIVAKRADSRYEDDPNLRIGSKSKIRPTAKKMEGETCSRERGSSSFRFHSGPLTVSYIRCFQAFRKSFRSPTCVINLILSEE